jgi:hypothetical protein
MLTTQVDLTDMQDDLPAIRMTTRSTRQYLYVLGRRHFRIVGGLQFCGETRSNVYVMTDLLGAPQHGRQQAATCEATWSA